MSGSCLLCCKRIHSDAIEGGMSIRHHHIVSSSAAVSLSLQQSSSSSDKKEEEYDKLSKMQSSSSVLSSIFASNVCLYVALIVVFVVWLLMMAKSLNINIEQLTNTAMESILPVDDLEDLPSYVLDKKSYYDTLPGYLSGIGSSSSSSSGSVIPDYYLRDEDLVAHYPRYYPLIDLLTAWPPRDVSRSQWRKSMAHPIYGTKNEEKYYSSSQGKTNIHRVSTSSQVVDGSSGSSSEQQSLINKIPNSLYRLNYRNESELAIAFKLRDKEVPYILYNVPELDEAAKSDFSADALQLHFGSLPRVVEKSEDNEFMYYTVKDTASSIVGQRFPDWKPPQQDILMSFRSFLREAINAETKNNVAPKSVTNEDSNKRSKYKEKDVVDIVGQRPLHYLVISASEGSRTKWIRHALPIFEPKESLFMREPEQYRGINCRFGMKGIISAPHYDSRTNYIAMIRGRKRYVIQPPSECSKLELLPRGHPSARHSAVLWSNLTDVHQYPHLMNSKATEVVLSMGELLYLPSFWFHYIISQDASIQCNARSGETNEGKEFISKCGFSRRFGGKRASPESNNADVEVDDVQEQVDQKSKQFAAGDAENQEDGLGQQRQKRMRRNKGSGKKKKKQGVDWSAMQ